MRILEKLSKIVREFVMIEGACAAGIATVKTLEGGPPSTDLTFVLPGAKSAVSYAVPLDSALIPSYLIKKDRLAFEKEIIRANAVPAVLHSTSPIISPKPFHVFSVFCAWPWRR